MVLPSPFLWTAAPGTGHPLEATPVVQHPEDADAPSPPAAGQQGKLLIPDSVTSSACPERGLTVPREHTGQPLKNPTEFDAHLTEVETEPS